MSAPHETAYRIEDDKVVTRDKSGRAFRCLVTTPGTSVHTRLGRAGPISIAEATYLTA